MIKELRNLIKYHNDADWAKEKEVEAAEFTEGTVSFLDSLCGMATMAIEKPVKEANIKWSSNGKYIFGEIGKTALFYIRDKNFGVTSNPILKYQLEIKFLDKRWESDNPEELKLIATEQLNILIKNILG